MKRRPSQRGNATPDPLLPDNATDPRGPGPFSPGTGGGHLERGTIINVDARSHVYRVALNSGRTTQMSRIRAHPGDLALLPVQTIVVVTWALGVPYILGVLPREVAASTTANVPHSVTDIDGHGGNDPVFQQNMGISARDPREPNDLIPGDFVGLSPDGASVAALHGQVAQIRGGPLSKVQAFGDNDLVQIIAGVYSLITWMGESKVINEDGKTSFIWRGGTDQLTQTGPNEQRYTIRLDVGHTGDVLRLEICNRDNQVVFRFHVSPTGACEIFSAGGLSQHGGGSSRAVTPTRVQGRRELDVVGPNVERVTGNCAHSCDGSYRRSIGGNDTRTVGGSQAVSVVGDHALQVAGDAQETVAGAKTVSVIGKCTHEVFGASDYAVTTQAGDITMTPDAGAFKVVVRRPDSIELGANATSHATKFEELQSTMTALKAQLDAAMALLLSHAHPALGAVAPTLAALPQSLNVDIQAARSTTTKIT